MRRFAFFAAALVVAVPLAGNALAQDQSASTKNLAAKKVPLGFSSQLTLMKKGKATAVVSLSKEPKQHLILVSAQETTVVGRTSTFKGNVVLQVELDGKKLMEFDADEATLIVNKE